MGTFLEKFLTFLGILVLAFLIDLLLAWPFMLLWNWLMPMIFGLTTLTFWQSFGLMLLASFLFKNSNSTNTSR